MTLSIGVETNEIIILLKNRFKLIGIILILFLALFTVGSGYSQKSLGKDSDGDGLSDFQEIHKYFTDPYHKDSDHDGIPDGDWNERREFTYTIKTIIRIVPLESDFNFNDDFQDLRVLERHPEYIEMEVIHYPI